MCMCVRYKKTILLHSYLEGSRDQVVFCGELKGLCVCVCV